MSFLFELGLMFVIAGVSIIIFERLSGYRIDFSIEIKKVIKDE